MPKVYGLIGLDCDRPRGDFIKTLGGAAIAEDKFKSLRYISEKLDTLRLPRTYFLCGQFLESMISKFTITRIRKLFESNSDLVEIADHSYSHNVFKKIKNRPDKVPLSVSKIVDEYRYNTDLFSNIFCKDMRNRGLRAPLGHWRGLEGENKVISALLSEGVLYVSSDLREEDDSICPTLLTKEGSVRQPYYYEGGLLEIPSHGWHDTAFGGLTKTPLPTVPPIDYIEIIDHYLSLFKGAVNLSQTRNVNIYVCLVMHPYNIWQYDKPRIIFDDFFKFSQDLGIEFIKYKNIYYKSLENKL